MPAVLGDVRLFPLVVLVRLFPVFDAFPLQKQRLAPFLYSLEFPLCRDKVERTARALLKRIFP